MTTRSVGRDLIVAFVVEIRITLLPGAFLDLLSQKVAYIQLLRIAGPPFL